MLAYRIGPTAGVRIEPPPMKRTFSSTAFKLNKSRFVPASGSYPKGFEVGALSSGVKKNNTLDLALLKSNVPASAAAVFTTNKFKAAPVLVSQKVIETSSGDGIQAIIINSGCANAVTGEGGLQDAMKMTQLVENEFKLPENSTLVMSTGVIGQRLKMHKIEEGVHHLPKVVGSEHDHWITCAKGIMTTDTFPKLVSKSFQISGKTYSLAGLAKGAGMICPNMATLLGFFVTDAPVTSSALSKILTHSVDRSFNCISVDGDMSTNDTIAAMANGSGGGDVIDEKSPNFSTLQEEITGFAQQLAQLVVRDGEGATKFIEVQVDDALSYSDAKTVARSISNSSLFKTAMFGQDANWGRILCATGYAGVEVNPAKTNVSFVPTDKSAELKLLVNGEPENVNEERASEILQAEDLVVRVSLGTGGGHSARFWTCDLTHDYVTINGDYRS